MIDPFCRQRKYVSNFSKLYGARQQLNIAFENKEAVNELFSWSFDEYCQFGSEYRREQSLLAHGSSKVHYKLLMEHLQIVWIK